MPSNIDDLMSNGRDAKDIEILARIDALFDADPDGFIEASEEPTMEDFAFIGQFIQLYCFADWCARRCIDAAREAAFDGSKRNAHKLMEKDVIPALRKAAKLLPIGNIQETLTRAAEIIEMHRDMRHNFAHWAVRRVPNEDVWILLSRDAREAKRRDGRDRNSYDTSYGLVPLKSLQIELKKLNDHTRNLSSCAYQLETRIDEVRELIAEKNRS